MKMLQEQYFFKFLGIKTEQFATLPEKFNSKKGTNLATSIEFKVDLESEKIGVFVKFDFLHGKNVFLKLEVSCHFAIEEDSWKRFIDKKVKNQIVIPKGLLAHLAMITVGTSRGVLFSKTEGTQFSQFIIPMVNVVEMIPEDMLINPTLDNNG